MIRGKDSGKMQPISGRQYARTFTQKEKELLLGVTETYNFLCGERHTDISFQYLSEQWFIIFSQAVKILKNTSQKFIPSFIFMITISYRVNQVLPGKTVFWDCGTDTTNARILSRYGKKYYQVFTNKIYFP